MSGTHCNTCIDTYNTYINTYMHIRTYMQLYKQWKQIKIEKGVGITLKSKETSGKLANLHWLPFVHANTIPAR